MRNGRAWWTTRRFLRVFSDARNAHGIRVWFQWCETEFFTIVEWSYQWILLLNRKLSIWSTTFSFWVILLMDKSCTSSCDVYTFFSPGAEEFTNLSCQPNWYTPAGIKNPSTKQIHLRSSSNLMMVPDFHGWFLAQSCRQKILSLIKDLTSKIFHGLYEICPDLSKIHILHVYLATYGNVICLFPIR